MASLMNDSDDRTLFSRSLLRRRQLPSQAKVRSTVQRIGSFTQPRSPSGRRTIDRSLAAKPVVDPVQGPVASPLVEVTPDGALGREIHRQVSPLAAAADNIEDGVEDVPHVRLAGPAAAGLGRDVGLDKGPLGVREVTGIMVCSHAITTSVTPGLFPLWDSLLPGALLGPEDRSPARDDEG